MKQWFIIIFTIFLTAVVFHQQKYVKHLHQESLQISQNNSLTTAKTVVAQGDAFKILFYDKAGNLNAQMSGDHITYFEDSTFTAEGNLIYTTFDERHNMANTIKTRTAIGIFEETDNAFLLAGNTQLKSLTLPEEVFFNFSQNEGKTKNVFIDVLQKTISSPEQIESNGADGQFSAEGFFYDIDKKNFKFNSKVKGIYKKNNK